MFEQIVVGVDEHDGGPDAIALAAKLAAPDGQLTLAFVYCGDPYVYRGASVAVEATERERTLERLEAVRAEAGIHAKLSFVASSSAGRGLHELAEREGVDLLVLGSCRRGLVGRVLVGDDTHAALDGAPCAVAIAPAGYVRESGVMREIGVGYDGSPESVSALGLAREPRGRVRRETVSVRGGLAPALPVARRVGSARRVDRRLREGRPGADRGFGRCRAARGLRSPSRGVGDVQRVTRPADCRLAWLRPDRTHDPREHLPPACAYRALSAPSTASRCSRDRDARGGGGRSRNRGGIEGMTARSSWNTPMTARLGPRPR